MVYVEGDATVLLAFSVRSFRFVYPGERIVVCRVGLFGSLWLLRLNNLSFVSRYDPGSTLAPISAAASSCSIAVAVRFASVSIDALVDNEGLAGAILNWDGLRNRCDNFRLFSGLLGLVDVDLDTTVCLACGVGSILLRFPSACFHGGSLSASTRAVSSDSSCLSSRHNSGAVHVIGRQALGEAFPFKAVPLLAAVEAVVSAVDKVVKLFGRSRLFLAVVLLFPRPDLFGAAVELLFAGRASFISGLASTVCVNLIIRAFATCIAHSVTHDRLSVAHIISLTS